MSFEDEEAMDRLELKNKIIDGHSFSNNSSPDRKPRSRNDDKHKLRSK